MIRGLVSSLVALLALLSTPAAAAEPAAATTDDSERDGPGSRSDRPWLRRWAPEPSMAEIGLYGGVLLPSRRVELFEADLGLPDQGYKPLSRVAPEFGVRAGYFPIRFFGVEAEGGAMPTRTTTDEAALLWTVRGSVVGQVGLWSVTPFVLAGAGLLGVASDPDAVGNDVDAAAHFGGGVKVFLSRYTALRLDVRDIIAARRGYEEGVIHNPEVLLGLTIALGRARDEAPPPPADTDADGILDPEDRCKDEPGVPSYQGCPIPDSDGDGIADPDDRCKDEPGVPDYQGCPIPDSDADGILDPDDQCKDEPGVPDFQGCPIPDSDADGILDPDDRCKDAPETANGFEDSDGCPDEIPEEVARFTGVIEGIVFETGKAVIRPRSKDVLQRALDVMTKYESVWVEISGHTDDRGSRETNMSLSQRRAEAVKQYLVDAGVDASRITTRGAGPDEPIADNRKKKGRAKNRRIEFELRTH